MIKSNLNFSRIIKMNKINIFTKKIKNIIAAKSSKKYIIRLKSIICHLYESLGAETLFNTSSRAVCADAPLTPAREFIKILCSKTSKNTF